jgi:hypothetical protein
MKGKPRSKPSLSKVGQTVDRMVNPYRRRGEMRTCGFVLLVFKASGVSRPRCVSTLGNEQIKHVLKLCLADLEGRIERTEGHA